VSATIVVLVAAGLFVRAVIYGFTSGPGFDLDRAVFLRVQVMSPYVSADTDLDARRQLMAEHTRRLEAGLRSLPSVEEVAIGPIGVPPIGPDELSYLLTPRTVEAGGERRDLRLGVVRGTPALLSALGVPIVRGRALATGDDAIRPQPSLVTVSLAGKLWPADDPLGQVMSVGPLGGRGGRYTVVGIAADFAYGSLTQPSAGVVVTIDAGGFGLEPSFVVRTGQPDILVEPIRRLVQEILPNAPRLEIATAREVIARDLGFQRLGAWFFSGFGLIALVLGAGGVFGLVAYLAESRRREFGVRLALGATSGNLVRDGVATGLAPVTVGATIGLIVAAFVARIFVSALPGLSVLDPLTYAGVALLMMGCAAVAGLTGAWRLRRISPSDALRAE
jgi:hypothetical protein